MDTSIPFFIAFVITIVWGPRAIKAVFGHKARLKWRLGRRRRTMIRDVDEGLVTVCGRVRAGGDVIEAPLSRSVCVGYEVEIERGKGPWLLPAVLLEKLQPFVVVDDSGQAWIDATGPFVLDLTPHRRGAAGPFGSDPPLERQALESLVDGGLFANYVYAEIILVEGKTIAVTGTASLDVTADGDRSTPRQPPHRLILRGTEQHPLLISEWDGR